MNTDDWAFCRKALVEVSRTFSKPIEMLPGALEHAVTCGYLLCRVADTIEDDDSLSTPDREELFTRFLAVMQRREPVEAFCESAARIWTGDDAESELARRLDTVMSVFWSLEQGIQDCVVPWVEEMARGMALYRYRRADNDGYVTILNEADLERYCYFVAGTVGQMLTALFTHWIDDLDAQREVEMREHAEAFALGLQLVNIMKNSFINERGTNMSKYHWLKHDIKCIFGDLNFRNFGKLTQPEIMHLIRQGDIQALQSNDEWCTFMRRPVQNKGMLRHYHEGTLTFPPTYKFKCKENVYDLKRSPAYTDRILFEQVHDQPQKNPLMNVYYNSAEIWMSDHKPIVGMFEAKIKMVDQQLRQRVIANLRRRYYTEVLASQRTSDERKQEFLSALEGQRQLADSQQDFVITNHVDPPEETKEYSSPVKQPVEPKKEKKSTLRTLATVAGFGSKSSATKVRPATAH